MSQSNKEELFDYVFRSLEVMTSHELPTEHSPMEKLPQESLCSELLKSTDEVRTLYAQIKDKH